MEHRSYNEIFKLTYHLFCVQRFGFNKCLAALRAASFICSALAPKVFFFNIGPSKEDIFSGHLLSPIFQSTLHITITSLCLGVDTVRFSCLLLCAQNLILACLTSFQAVFSSGPSILNFSLHLAIPDLSWLNCIHPGFVALTI